MLLHGRNICRLLLEFINSLDRELEIILRCLFTSQDYRRARSFEFKRRNRKYVSMEITSAMNLNRGAPPPTSPLWCEYYAVQWRRFPQTKVEISVNIYHPVAPNEGESLSFTARVSSSIGAIIALTIMAVPRRGDENKVNIYWRRKGGYKPLFIYGCSSPSHPSWGRAEEETRSIDRFFSFIHPESAVSWTDDKAAPTDAFSTEIRYCVV